MLAWTSFSTITKMAWLYMFISIILWCTCLASTTRVRAGVLILPKNMEELSERDLRQIISRAIEDRCLKNANQKAFLALKRGLFNFRCCILNNIRVPANNEMEIKNTISEFPMTSRKVYRCLEMLTQQAEPCWNNDENYLSDLFLRAHNATVDRFSVEDGKNLKSAIAAFQHSNCTPPIRLLPEYLYETCVPKLDHFKALNVSSYVLKQADFCHDLTIANDCVIGAVTSQCNDDEDVVENIKQIFDYFLEFCQNKEAADSVVTKVLFE